MSLRRRAFAQQPPTVYHMTAEQRACMRALNDASKWIGMAARSVRIGESAECSTFIAAAQTALVEAVKECPT